VRRRLGKDETDHELPEDDDRPGPEETGRAADDETVVEEGI
jgi:hypothetical protein